jgi:nucleoside-diphosphate-sugar epimerase
LESDTTIHNILVTGGTGMVGAHLLHKLSGKGYNIFTTYRDKQSILKAEKIFSFYTDKYKDISDSINWIECDLTDRNMLKKLFSEVDCVINCAAVISFSPGDEKSVISSNIDIASSVVDSCLESDVKRLIHLSSIASLGDTENGEEHTEENIWKSSKNKSAYSISKFESEMEVWRGIYQGLNAIILNPSIIIGPGDWDSGSPSIIKQIDKGLPFYTNAYNGYTSVYHVTDAIYSALKGTEEGKRYIVSSDNLSYKDLIYTICNTLKRKAPGKLIKRWLFKPITFIGEVFNRIGIRNKFNKQLEKSIFNSYFYNGTLITKELDFRYSDLKKDITTIVNIYLDDKQKQSQK